jgi:hypothetical protein
VIYINCTLSQLKSKLRVQKLAFWANLIKLKPVGPDWARRTNVLVQRLYKNIGNGAVGTANNYSSILS